jgi:hypothetical protein
MLPNVLLSQMTPPRFITFFFYLWPDKVDANAVLLSSNSTYLHEIIFGRSLLIRRHCGYRF